MATGGLAAAWAIGPDFRRLWLAQAFSSFGEYLFAGTSTVWVATRLFPDSPRLPAFVGAVILAESVPRIVVGPIAGVYADRWRARKTMIVNDCLRAGLFVALLLLGLSGTAASAEMFVVLLICICLSATSAQFFNPSRAAVMQLVVPEDRRVDAASMSMLSLTGVAVLASAAGPAVFALFGAAVAVSVCIATYAISGIMTVLVRDRYHPQGRAVGRFRHDFSDGLRVAWRAPMLRVVLVGACFYGVSLGINNSVLALFGLKSLDLAPSHYGVLAMMFPLGNMIGAAVGGRFVKGLGIGRAYLLALTALGVGYAGYACAGRLSTACVLMLVCGAVFSIYIMCQGSLLQSAVPEGYMGRISAVLGPLVSMTSAVSTLFASQVLAFAGTRGIVAGDGGRLDPYRLLIMFGAAFLLIGGGAMYFVRRGARKDELSSPVSVADAR
ncbi:MFS transporter [Nocardia caishijiensis]|uniref:Na+/melibiose symporter-like transporter n=1 Tax=Nocardia caishijiensis TaxID=184756 RepID=A0ABQ6YSB5_9NOCA|nr:MFS transporter [Nocardia caishijiensis]KAF0848601.1 Na+/melibiose symporter-like transporter [Nocardia caishijiensis]